MVQQWDSYDFLMKIHVAGLRRKLDFLWPRDAPKAEMSAISDADSNEWSLLEVLVCLSTRIVYHQR